MRKSFGPTRQTDKWSISWFFLLVDALLAYDLVRNSFGATRLAGEWSISWFCLLVDVLLGLGDVLKF